MNENNYYARIKELNISHYAGEVSYYAKAPLREVEKKLLASIPKGSRILDVGCGSGRFSIGAAQSGHTVIGIDITLAAITAASKKAKSLKLDNVSFLVGDMTEMSFQNNEFDYVFCPRFSINAVATFQKRKKAINEMMRVVKSGGTVYVESFNKLYLGRGPIVSIKRDEIYFTEVVEWVSSAPVILLKVEGDEAVDAVKWRIVGRYPNGIRGQYSENWIRNVAHVPDSTDSALRELELAEPIFERSRQMHESRLSGKMIFALTGMSECGKSTVGKYLDPKGVSRLKIVKLFERVRDKWSPNDELYAFLKWHEERDPYALWDAFIDELVAEMDRLGTNAASIESLYGGGLGSYLKQKLSHHFCIVFIDIPLEVRLGRQMQRENLPDIKSAKRYLLPRDEIKERSGIPALKEIAGEVVDNSGTLEELYRMIDQIVKKYLS